MGKMNSADNRFFDLTWKDLETWAGSRIFKRGKEYQGDGRVVDLAIARDGSLVATVDGTRPYATQVWCDMDGLSSDCTCPYESDCKHAVAVVLEYLALVEDDEEIPCVSEKDDRLLDLESGGWRNKEANQGLAMPTRDVLKDVRAYLETWELDPLREFVLELAEKDSGICNRLLDMADLASGREENLVEGVRQDLAILAEGEGWDPWEEEECSEAAIRVENRLAALMERGKADEVAGLGFEILEAGNRFEGSSQDAFLTEQALADSLKRVYEALLSASIPPSERLVQAMDLDMKDSYGLCSSGADLFWSKRFDPKAWSGAADTLLARLEGKKPLRTRLERARARSRRDTQVEWAIQALEKAGRTEEIIPLCEKRAVDPGGYRRLVEQLIGMKRYEEAEDWGWRGIEEAEEVHAEGESWYMRRLLLELHEKMGDWPTAASFRAEGFFSRPSEEAYAELEHVSAKAGLWPPVREAALVYLETGRLPWDEEGWPLKTTRMPLKEKDRYASFPLDSLLVSVAILEDRPGDALEHYDRLRKKGPGPSYPLSERTADAVAEAFPERAAEIWQHMAETQIAQTKPAAYKEAMIPLEKARNVLQKLGKEEAWTDYVAAIRKRHRRKRRLMEMLDSLEG